MRVIRSFGRYGSHCQGVRVIRDVFTSNSIQAQEKIERKMQMSIRLLSGDENGH